eukprot:gene843-933_t
MAVKRKGKGKEPPPAPPKEYADKAPQTPHAAQASHPMERATIPIFVKVKNSCNSAEFAESFDLDSSDRHVIQIRDPVTEGRTRNEFEFTKVFGPNCNNNDLQNDVGEPLCDHVLNGFNSALIAYGESDSGKSHTLFNNSRSDDRGMLARMSEYLFENTAKKHSYKEIGVTVSFMEIYNNRIRDLGRAYVNGDNSATGPREFKIAQRPTPTKGLLSSRNNRPGSANYGGRYSVPLISARSDSTNSSNGGMPRRPQSAGASGAVRKVNKAGDAIVPDPSLDSQDLVIWESDQNQVSVKELSLIPVRSITEVNEVLEQGIKLRNKQEKKLNANSKKSHTIFSVTVVQRDRGAPNAEPISATLHLVECAGSERSAKSKSEGKRFEEAVQINSSLSTLQSVICGLSTDISDCSNLNYKGSKLTRVLQNSLDAKSFVSVIANINPEMESYQESLRTLQFIENCKAPNLRKSNVHNDPEKASQDRRICRLLSEISDLKQQNDVAKANFNSKVDYLCQTVDAEPPPGFFKSTERADFQAETHRINEELKKVKMEADQKVELHRQAARSAMDQVEKTVKAFDQCLWNQRQKDEKHRKQCIAIQEKNYLLQEDIKMAEFKHEQELQNRTVEFSADIKKIIEQTREIVEEKDSLFKKIPEVLKDTKHSVAVNEQIWSDRMEQTKREHSDHVTSMKESLLEQKDNMEKQYQQFLKTKDDDCREWMKWFEKYRAKKKGDILQYQVDLVNCYELCQSLSQVIEDIEKGRYPSQYQSGIRTVPLPKGVKPKIPTKDHFERLAEAFQATRSRARDWKDLKRSKQDVGPNDSFDLDSFTQSFTEVGTNAARSMLDHLSVGQLQQVAHKLKEFQSTSFGSVDQTFNSQSQTALNETEQLRGAVLNEMTSDRTIEYIQHLENQLEHYKHVAMSNSVRANSAQVALESARRSLSRPSTAAVSRS